MDAEEVHKSLKHRPFEPFRVHVSDGSSYEIKHPEQVVLSRRAAHVGIGGDGNGVFQDIAIVSLIHITRIEPLKRREPKPKRRPSG